MSQETSSDRFARAIEYDLSHDTQYGDNPHGSIQWKGTDVCIDLYCTCGAQEHFDGDFFYHYECSQCHKKYSVGKNVKLIELPPEIAKIVEEEATGFKMGEGG